MTASERSEVAPVSENDSTNTTPQGSGPEIGRGVCPHLDLFGIVGATVARGWRHDFDTHFNVRESGGGV